MKKEFTAIDLVALSKIEVGSRETYCQGQITARILKKKLLNQPLHYTDFICR